MNYNCVRVINGGIFILKKWWYFYFKKNGGIYEEYVCFLCDG